MPPSHWHHQKHIVRTHIAHILTYMVAHLYSYTHIHAHIHGQSTRIHKYFQATPQTANYTCTHTRVHTRTCIHIHCTAQWFNGTHTHDRVYVKKYLTGENISELGERMNEFENGHIHTHIQTQTLSCKSVWTIKMENGHTQWVDLNKIEGKTERQRKNPT